MDQVEDFLTDQDVQESWKFEDFGGQKLLADHVENIRVEWSASYPSRAFATATKRFLFYKHLGMGIYNDMEDEDEEGGEEEEEESPGFNMMVLPNAELCGLWLVTLLLLFTFEYGILHQGVPDLRGGLEGEPVEEHRGQPRVRSPPGRPSAGERKWTTKKNFVSSIVLRWAPPGWAWSTAPLALERLLSAEHSPTRSPKYGTLLLFLRRTIFQVAIQLTGEPGTFTQGILVDVNSQSLCSKVLNLFLLIPALSICSGLARVANWCRGSLTT